MTKFYLLACLTLSFYLSKAQVGNLDPAFGLNGVQTTKFIGKGTLISAKGESFGVQVISDSYNPSVRVYKYLSNGNVDLSYGSAGITLPTTMKYFTSAIQDDGKVVVVGTVVYPYFTNIHDQTKIVRFNRDGSVDFSYTNPALGTYYSFPTKLVKQDSSLVLFGYNASAAAGMNNDFIFTFNNTGVTKYNISSLRSNSNSSTYNYNLGIFSQTKSVAIKGNEVIVAGLEQLEGTTFPYMVSSGYYVSKYVNGILDPAFGNGGRVAETLPATAYDHMSIAPNGKLLIVNSVINAITNNSDFRVVRFNENGSPDLTFNVNSIQTTDFGSNDTAYAVAYDESRIIVAGSTQNKTTGDKEFAIARYNDNGSLDSTFSDDGKQTLGAPGLLYQLEQIKTDSNRLFASGSISSNSGETYKITAAYLLKNSFLIVCPASKSVVTDKGICAAMVNEISPVITPLESNAPFTYTLTGATTGSGAGSASGILFNKGATVLSYKLADEPLKTCSSIITVEDKEAPVITNLSANPHSIWPPNHKMIDVEVNYNLADNCGNTKSEISVSSNEPYSGTDLYDVAGDWKIIDGHHLQLRAERAEKGKGRIYSIKIIATDSTGNKSEQQTTVAVPYDDAGVKGPTDFSVRILSNPTRDFFTLLIQSNRQETVSLRVCDLFGRLIEARSDITPNGTFQLGSKYHPGIYIAELKQGSKKLLLTLVKF